MKTRTILYHLLFWAGIYLLWVLAFRSYSVTLSNTMTIEFCYLLFITADYYAINYFVPRFLRQKKYILFVLSTLTIITFSAWLRTLVAQEMSLHFFHSPSQPFSSVYLNSVINISLWVLVLTIGKMIVDKIETQQQLEWMEREREKSELNYLKAQINPHSLFNSLNTIYGHIDKNNQMARNILLQFSELLRYQLYDCGAEKVSLEKEIEYIKNYVAFQRLRKEEKLRVIVEIESVTAGLLIAPLMLVVLIENAFKFVSSFPENENKIILKISTRNKVLHCSVINTKESKQNSTNASGGIGIENLKRRLALLYPERFEISTKIENELYETNLIIDLT